MIPKQAIEKAIEGGWLKIIIKKGYFWEHSGYVFAYHYDGNKVAEVSWQQIVLDAKFWQSLAKALGWMVENWGTCPLEEAVSYRGCAFCTARHFYDIILTGGDTEKFWEEVLK